MRGFHKKNLVLVALILLILVVTMGHNYSTYSSYIRSPSVTRQRLKEWTSSDQKHYHDPSVYLHQPQLPPSYDKLLSKYSISDLLQLTKSDRCDLYFDELPKDWTLPNFKDEFSYSIDIYNDREYFNQNYNKLKGADSNFEQVVDTIFKDVEAKKVQNLNIEDQLLDAVYKYRTYASCYLGSEESKYCKKIDAKMFPWFSFKSPIYERWDGKVVDNYANMRSNYPDGSYKKMLNYDPSACYWTKFQKEMYGKGIVLSVSDKFADDLLRLIKLLRYHRNTLPIQFVHKGDLSKEKQKLLTIVARKTLILEGSVTLNDYKQELWFVNTERCISEAYKDYFKSYTNKWLAVLFNTFEDMMLMDTDVALYVSPEYMFGFSEYKSKGAFFFKDRYGIDSVHRNFPKLWKKMLPSMMEASLFETPQVTDHTLNNEFFTKNSRHIMEAGVVLLNRKTHLAGMLLSTQIQLWQPLTIKLHGEKDIFWLGQSMMGNEDYLFNTHYSGAAGLLEEKEFEVSNLIVSALPAHLDPHDNHTLLWLNSGLTFCKKNSWEKDAKEVFAGKFSEEELKRKYQSTVEINLLIIPPEVWKLRDKDSNELDPTLKEPKYSWRLRWDLGCSGYLWSAHSVVDGVKGLEIRYKQPEIENFAKTAKVWSAQILKVID